MIEDVSGSAAAKETRLREWLVSRPSIAIGFSGGVDSAYLAAVAVESLGRDRVVGIIGRSASYPEVQWVTAKSFADQIGLDVVEIDTDELNDLRYAANPSNRCYFCKSELWSRVAPVARERGIDTIADGTNADDLTGHRPGAVAAREQGVVSPLAMFDFTKDEIRDRSKARGLPTWAQPSSPCLSSRIPYGTPVTVARLRRVEEAESALRALGVIGDLRVRHFGTKARVEMTREQVARWSAGEARQLLETTLIAVGYDEIETVAYRSGALNELSIGAALSGD